MERDTEMLLEMDCQEHRFIWEKKCVFRWAYIAVRHRIQGGQTQGLIVAWVSGPEILGCVKELANKPYRDRFVGNI